MDHESLIKYENAIEQIIQTEGILVKGFGIIPKYPMLDQDLDISAKGIYAYFCSLAGSGTTSFPSVKTILKHLGIAEKTYYKYYKELHIEGYISVQQERKKDGIYGKNIITLLSNPKKFTEQQDKPPKNHARVRHQGMKSFGYGIIPRAVMFDERLGLKAKAIYAYFCSFAGNNDFAFPQRGVILFHLNINKTSYYKFYNALVHFDYLTVEQRRIDNGNLSVNDYILNEFPNPSSTDLSPCPNFYGSDKKAEFTDVEPCLNIYRSDENPEIAAVEPCPNFSCTDLSRTDLSRTDLSCTVKYGSNINNKTSNSIKEDHSLTHYQPAENERTNDLIKNYVNLSSEGKIKLTAEIVDELVAEKGLPYTYKNEPVKIEIAIKILVGYTEHYYENQQRQETFDLFIKALVDLCTFEGTKTLKNSVVTYAQVIKNLNSIISSRFNQFTIEYSLEDFAHSVMRNFNSALESVKIKNYFTYLQACIWDGFSTYKVKETNLFATDDYLNDIGANFKFYKNQ